MKLRHALSACLLALLAGCSNSGGDEGDVGICLHSFEDEVLHIDQASGATTDAVIGEVLLSQFVVNDHAVPADDLVVSRHTNVTVEGDKLRCVVPCSFGLVEGDWQFVAEATGYAPTAQSVSAAYATFVGGCPSYDTDGTHVEILLDESGG
ncbi:MAG: hypothetical protein PHP86_14550 [Nevskiales bacterium]|nr:hypothetical protein [Nevskiales bacterium]